jgi:hypothetical protein
LKTNPVHHSPTPIRAFSQPRSITRRGKSLAAVALALVSQFFIALPARSGAAPTPPPAKTERKSAHILSVDLKARRITLNPMQFLTGAAALKALQRDHPGATEVMDDHYTVESKERVVLPLAKDVVVKLVFVGGTAHTPPVAVDPTKLAGYPSLSDRPFWIAIRGGTVIAIEEQFVP